MRTQTLALLLSGAILTVAAIAAFAPDVAGRLWPRAETIHNDLPTKDSPMTETTSATNRAEPSARREQATFGSGCFWCTEAVFQQLKGVESVVSGYSGGKLPNPTYEDICTGLTGHAEVIQVTFDPAVVSYADLLEAFWKSHDPTTLNQQGNDTGTQYRSVVYYHNDDQRRAAEHYKQKLDQSGAFGDPIVTEISPLDVFYPAEKYHQNYYNDNPRQGYCAYIIGPKLEKFRAAFKDKVK